MADTSSDTADDARATMARRRAHSRELVARHGVLVTNWEATPEQVEAVARACTAVPAAQRGPGSFFVSFPTATPASPPAARTPQR